MSAANIKTIKEIILDERRLVTYISLSKELCMHVNQVKTLMQKCIDDIRKSRPDVVLNVNIVVAGLSKDNGARITLCSEADLHEKITSFKSVFFQHVYSVCYGSNSVDGAVLASTSSFDDFPLCVGLIKGTTCAKRSSKEIGTLKTNSQHAIEEPKVNILVQKDVKNKVKTEIIKGNAVVKNQESKSVPIVLKSENIEKREVQTNKKNGVNSNGIAGFFNRANSSPSAKKSKSDTNMNNNDTKNTDKKIEIKVESMDVDEDNKVSQKKTGLEVQKVKSELKDSKESKVNLDKNNKKEVKNNAKNKKEEKSIDKLKKNAKVDKKRKRVLHVSDSESDEDKNDPFAEAPAEKDSDDEIPPTPSTSTVKITSGFVNPKKKRKIVDKTYTDEDGYILTRKEEIYESCSDNEEEKSTKENIMSVNHVKPEVSPTQNKTKISKKKISPPQKGKQSSIMSFFQKK